MDILTAMSPAQAAAMNIGLLILMMLGLKMYVGARRGQMKLPSGETNPEFNRATRVQLNAVEDVPVLMVGIAGLAMLGMPAWYIHMCGLVLFVSRILHAYGLAGSGGFSIGRAVGTMGTLLVFLAIAGALLVHAFIG
ncbi:MAG: MAPEG family protein [Hyphomonadaceae bacterium]|jgi:uncharacterized membrane protein YecN with MAPEG domain|nr:MAPEG family protein [Hyphomonadaceae bacterium]